jgi:hypothetical protein
MTLTAEQHSQIAVSYERAAADRMVPLPQREAFARKASWFRMLARIEAKKQAAASKEGPASNSRRVAKKGEGGSGSVTRLVSPLLLGRSRRPHLR